MKCETRVLVVDDQCETTEVLRAVLEPRGMTIERAPHRAGDARTCAAAIPELVVVDADSAASRGLSPASWPTVPTIVMGTLPADCRERADDGTTIRRLRKPFHYADLLRAIDSLVAEKAA